ncbi:MAG: hypothetical protein Ct9H300mP1_24490 [Planctomycetaceae bacterium]|nr:MAG: hypothetical protein Ct9H300mP1_24490 [Planctomycetaceae bacterium]
MSGISLIRLTRPALMLAVLLFGAVVEAAPPPQLPRDLYKSGTAIRNAFRPIVKGTARATVAVLVNGRQKARGANRCGRRLGADKGQPGQRETMVVRSPAN